LFLAFFTASAAAVQTAVIVKCTGAFSVLFAKPQSHNSGNGHKPNHRANGGKPISAFASTLGTARFVFYDGSLPICILLLAVLLQYVQKS
jgi:hypothetical protein